MLKGSSSKLMASEGMNQGRTRFSLKDWPLGVWPSFQEYMGNTLGLDFYYYFFLGERLQ